MRYEPTADANSLSASNWPAGSRRVFQRPDGPPGAAPPGFATLVALPLLAAVLLGSLVVFTEVNALVICVAVLTCVFVLLDFRIGVVCLIVLMPLSASSLFPHSIGGIPGLNPLNLLLVGTLGSCVLHGGLDAALWRALRPLAWLYVLPLLVGGIIGSQHFGKVSAELAAAIPQDLSSLSSYLLNAVVKPLFIVLFGVLVAAATARIREPERLVVPMLVSIWALCLMTIAFALHAGVSLAELSSSQARTFFSPLGIHANDLGRLYAVAYGLMLYTFAASKDAALRLVLIVSMGLVVLALMLTFSRGAFFGFTVVNLLFLLSLRKALPLLLGVALLAALALSLPGVVFERIASGWSGGLNAFSSGRVDEIWLPLLPEVLGSPIYGSGLGSIAWSDALRAGRILIVGHAHNAYLNAALDLGLIGLAMLCAYFAHVWAGLRRLSADPHITPLLRGFYAGAAAGLVSFLLAGFSGSSLTPALEQIFLWLAIGMMVAQRRRPAATSPC